MSSFSPSVPNAAFNPSVSTNGRVTSKVNPAKLTNITRYFNSTKPREGTHAYYYNNALPNHNKSFNETYGMKLFKTINMYNTAHKTSDILQTFDKTIPGGIVYPYTDKIKISQLPQHLASLLKQKIRH